MSYANLKKNKTGETLILIGIGLHILNIILVLLGVWGDMSNVLLTLFAIATIPYIVGFIYIKKSPSAIWGVFLLFLSLFLTHYIAALFFVVGCIFTIYVARQNKHMLQKQ